MKTATLKSKINKAIANVNDEQFLQAIYTIINSRYDDVFALTENEIAEIEIEKKLFKSGKLETFTPSEIRNRLEKKYKK